VGEGNIVVFGFKTFWRGHTSGAYAFHFNTLLCAGNLNPSPVLADADVDG